MIHIAVVEDEEIFRDTITNYLRRFEKEYTTLFKLSLFSDGDQIVHKYNGNFDIILMDIQMHFMNGMHAAEEIRKLDSKVIIIFITNMTQYAIRGYEVDAMDYIVKPVEYFSFSQKLAKAIHRIPSKDEKILTISSEGGVKKISVEDLLYLESYGHQILYVTVRESIPVRTTMKELEKALTPLGFFRIAKSYLVNMHHVEGILSGCCVIGRARLPISRTKKKAFMEALVKYLS